MIALINFLVGNLKFSHLHSDIAAAAKVFHVPLQAV